MSATPEQVPDAGESITPASTGTGDFTFPMGEYSAHFPGDRLYATNHMWALSLASGTYRFGLTQYAVRLLQDVYFLDWIVEARTPIKSRQQIGSIESKKAESDLYAPVAGMLAELNAEVLDDPSLINADTYGDGWLFEMTTVESGLIIAPDYRIHLDKAWDVAQRTIKGQANH